MAITCTIDNPEIFERLYQMSFISVSKNEKFNIDNFLKTFYKELIENEISPEVAAKYIKLLPKILATIMSRNLGNKDIINKLDFNALIDLDEKFNSEDGISYIINEYGDSKKIFVNLNNEEDNEEDNDDLNKPSVIVKQISFKTNPAFSGSLEVYEKKDPTKNKEDIVSNIEKLQKDKIHIINTLLNIKLNVEQSEDSLVNIVYDGETLMLKPVLLKDIYESLDETEKKDYVKLLNLEGYGTPDPNSVPSSERIVLVITNKNGEYLYFNEDGAITDEQNGKLVYQYMRHVLKENGKYKVTNFFKNDLFKNIDEIAQKQYNKETDGNYADYLKKFNEKIQKDYEYLFNLQQKIYSNDKNENILLSLIDITKGVYSLQSSPEIKLNDLENFSINLDDVLKTLYQSNSKTGQFAVKVNSNDVSISRPIISSELIEKIISVFTSDNIDAEMKSKYIEQFLPEWLNRKNRFYDFVYTDKSGLSINIRDKERIKKTEQIFFKNINEDNVVDIKQKIRNVLQNIQIAYNTDLKNNFLDYNIEQNELFTGDYISFIKNLNPTLQLLNANDFYNYYNNALIYSIPDIFLNDLSSSLEKINKENKIEDKTLYEKILDESKKIDNNKEQKNSDSFNFTAAFENYVKNNELTADEINTFMQDLNDYSKMIGYPSISEKQMNIILGAINSKKNTVSIKDNEINIVEQTINPDVDSPATDKKITDIDLNDPAFENLDRKNFKKEKITDEELKNIKQWWNSKALEPLRKVISFNHMYNLVNSDVYATFIVNASKLANPDGTLARIDVNLNKGNEFDQLTLYHEAWHVFSQLFLSPEEKLNLYNELKYFKDKKGKQPYINKSFRELEEMLAEDFRNYARTQKPISNSPVRNSLFKKIIDFFKYLFGKLNVFSKKDILIDSMNSVTARNLFNNLYTGKINNYQPLISNVLEPKLDRGIRKVSNKNIDILNNQDSTFVVKTIDNIWGEVLNDIYEKRKEAGHTSLQATNILFLVDKEKRMYMYEQAKNRLEEKLKEFKDELKKESKKDTKSFNNLKTLDEIKKNSVAVIKSKIGENKYVFLESQILDFDMLTQSNKRGDRIKGDNYYDIKIVADFYKHNSIKEKNKPVNILIVSKLSDANEQFKNYKNSEAEEFTDIIINDSVSEIYKKSLSAKESILLDNIRILQSTLKDWGDSKSGVVKYHTENTDFKVSKKEYSRFMPSEKSDELNEDEYEIDQAAVEEAGKISLFDMLNNETVFIIKSLFKVDKENKNELSYSKDRFGFNERADFKNIFILLYKIIGGISDRNVAYNKLKNEYKNFPELIQFFETKFPSPDTKNTLEYNTSAKFFFDFSRPKVKYWQLLAYLEDGLYNYNIFESSLSEANIIAKWSSLFNTLKSEYVIKNEDNRSILDIKKVFNKFKNKNNNKLNLKKQLEFASSIGIYLSNVDRINNKLLENSDFYGLEYIFNIISEFNKLNESDKLSKKSRDALNSFLESPLKDLRENIDNNIFIDSEIKSKIINQSTQINRLASLEAELGLGSASSAVIRANGNTAYEVMYASSAIMNLDSINSAEKFSDLSIDDDIFGNVNYLNPEVNSFTKHLNIFKSLFNNFQDKIKNTSLKLVLIDGTSIADGFGQVTNELDPLSKYQQDINMLLLKGISELPRTADKKNTFGLVLNGKYYKPIINNVQGTDENVFVDLKFFNDETNKDKGDDYAIKGFLLNYLEAEFDRIKKFRGENKDELLKITGYNREVKKGVYAGQVFTAFDNILSNKNKELLYKLAISFNEKDSISTLNEYLKSPNNLKLYNSIIKDIKNYFNKRVENTYKYNHSKLIGFPVFPKAIYEKLELDSIDLNRNMIINLNNDVALNKKIIKAYLYNDFIDKFEKSTILFGDAAQWDHSNESWSKRIPGAISDGFRFLFDKGTISFINDVFNKTSSIQSNYADVLSSKLNKEFNNYNFSNTINVGVIQDAIKNSIYLEDFKEAWLEDYSKNTLLDKNEIEMQIDEKLAAFEDMIESDGAALMTFDAYRILHKVSERGWSKDQEDLYQKIIKGEFVDPKIIKQFFPVYKLHLHGSIKNAPISTIAMHKFSVVPLIPGQNAKEGSGLYDLHLKMLKENVQYVVFKSGSKGSELTSNRKPDNIFKNIENNTGVNNDVLFTKNTVYLANLKEVTVINDTFKNNLPIASQTRVIITDFLYSQGKLINEENKEIADDYNNIVKDYSDLLLIKLLDEIGFKLENGKYVNNGNFKKLINVIRDELTDRDVPDHLIRLLKTNKKGDKIFSDFSIHPNAQSIEKLLMSIVQNRLIRQTINGESLTQVPSTFTNGIWDNKFKNVKSKELREILLGTNTLPFYVRGKKIKNKRTSTKLMKVAVALQGNFLNLLNAIHPDGKPIETIDRLNVLIQDEEWLNTGNNRDSITMYGPRIPNDGLNTIEGAEVWYFFDGSFGNSIVLPTEIVGKAGSDYDGDKLSFSMPNIDKDGKYINIGVSNFKNILKATQDYEFNDNLPIWMYSSKELIEKQEKYLQNQYIKASLNILKLPENYARLINPNLTFLVDQYINEVPKNNSKYNRFQNISDVDGITNDSKEISPTRIYEDLYNLDKFNAFLSLSPSLGIQAKITKNHVLFKMIGAKMPKSYKNKVYNFITKEMEESFVNLPFIIRFDHNTIKENNNEFISLSGEKTKKGNKITDINSHILNGILDRASKAWPADLQLNSEAINVISYLIQAGVSEEEVFLFVTRPLMVQYFSDQVFNKSAYNEILNGVEDRKSKYNIASDIFKSIFEILQEKNKVLDEVNFLKLKNTINSLDKNTYRKFIIVKKENNKNVKFEYTFNELKNENFNIYNDILYIIGLNLDNKNIIEEKIYEKSNNLYNDKQKKEYNFSNNLVYLSEVFSKRILKNKITIDDLTKFSTNSISYKELALFLNFIELEEQFSGMTQFQMIFAPDSSKLTTMQQVLKRKETYQNFKKNSKLDVKFINDIMSDSILSSFNQDDLIVNLLSTVFPLRLNKEITNFISKKLLYSKAKIKKRFGKGVKGEEYFTNIFNGSIINYIYQNYISEFQDPISGETIEIPKEVDSRTVIIDNESDKVISIIDNNIVLNQEKITNDYNNKEFQSDDAFDKFKSNHPFKTLASYIKYIIHKELLLNRIPIDSVNEDVNYNEYISELALLNSFNSLYIMGKTKYSYTDTILNIVNSFNETKSKFPILNELALLPISSKQNVKILTLNNADLIDNNLATIYHKNLRDLADITITKDNDDFTNSKINEFFKYFSLIAYYQHGVNKTKFSINNVLDGIQYTDLLNEGSNIFQKNINESTLELIFKSLFNNEQYQLYTKESGVLNDENAEFIESIDLEDIFKIIKPTQPGVSKDIKGTIQLELIEDLVQQGKAKITVRNYDKVSGIYKSTKTDNLYDIVNRGKVKMVGDKIVGVGVSYTLDEFGAAEGFDNWAGFVKAAKFAGVDIQKGKEVYLYDITPAGIAEEKTTPVFDSLPGKSDTPTMTYAGIGSRETPQEVLDTMTKVATYLESLGYTLNTGKTFKARPSTDPRYQKQYEERLAFSKKYDGKVGLDEEGADRAFSLGATKKNLFGVDTPIGTKEMQVMEEIHPNPNALKEGAKKLMARNTNQVFGANLDTPVDFVLFYAKEVPGSIRPQGGTGQAVEMSRKKGIPTINLADANWRDQLKAVLSTQPTTQSSTSVNREYTPENITKSNLPANGFFVFGSNDRGIHGLGAAQSAVTNFGAVYGQASGQQGKSFAIRTKMYQNNKLTKYNELTDENKALMDKMTIKDLNDLRLAAIDNPNNKYYVTEIGTKLAGRSVEQMKNFFIRMNNKFGIPDNIILPQVFEVRTTQPTEGSEQFYQLKNIYNSINELETKFKRFNKTSRAIGSNKKIDEFLKKLNIESQIRSQFIQLLEDNPELKDLKLSDVMNSYLKEFIKDSDKQYYTAIQEELDLELEDVLINYFSKFKIRREELNNLKEKFGVDTVGVFDVLAKTIYYEKNRNLLTLPEEYGHVFVELLGSISKKGANNPLFTYLINNIENWDGYKRVLNDYKNTYVTDEGNIDIYKIKKEAIGQAIGIALVRNYKVQKGDKGFWNKIQQVIDYILNLIGGINYVSLNTTVDSIAKDILSKDYSKLDRLNKDTSNYNLLSYSETIKLQNQKDNGQALNFMKWFSNAGMIITGSLAYRLQGNTYRPAIDALHDIDNIVPSDVHGMNLLKENFLSPEELENDKIYRKLISEGNYKEAKKYKLDNANIRLNVNDIYNTIPILQKFQKEFPDVDFLYSFYNQKANAYYVTINAIWSKDQSLKDRFKSYSGSFNDRLLNFTEEELDKIYLFDFFLRPEVSDEYVKIYDSEFGLTLAHFNYAFYEKLNMMGRPKDAYDYQMWDYFDDKNILPPNFNDRMVYYQLNQSEKNKIKSKQDTEEFKEFLEKPSTSGVEELFDSNPKLANAVYEALGFTSNLPPISNKEIEFLLHTEKLKINLQDITLEEEGNVDLNSKDKWNTFAIKAKGKKLGYIQVKYKDDNTVKIGLSALYEGKEEVKKSIISKILDLINNIFKTKKVETSDKKINVNAGKGVGKLAYELLAVKLKREYQKDLLSDTTRSDYAENLWKSFEKQGKASVIGKTDTQYRWDYYYKFNVDNQLTPQQQQQAQQLYSQYLEQTGRQDIEGFKEFVSEPVGEVKEEIPFTENKMQIDGLEESIKEFMKIFIEKGKIPTKFISGLHTWKLNKNFYYDLIDEQSNTILLKNVNMKTGKIVNVDDTNTPISKEFLDKYIKDFEKMVIEFNMESLLSYFSIDLQDVYKRLNNIKSKEELIKLETEINNKLCQ